MTCSTSDWSDFNGGTVEGAANTEVAQKWVLWRVDDEGSDGDIRFPSGGDLLLIPRRTQEGAPS